MKISLFKKILYRIPQFPIDANLYESWEELKKSIATSSPSFYELISSVTPKDLNSLPEKTALTIQRYFNRAKFRATPFGTFASFGLMDNESLTDSQPLSISSEQLIHKFIDWPRREEFLSYDFEDLIRSDSKIFTNSSYYRVGSKFRYIYSGKEKFELIDVDFDQRLLLVLVTCKYPIKISQLIQVIIKLYKTEQEAKDVVESMIVAQMLVTELDANIIGEDYFKRRGVGIQDSNTHYIISERKHIGGNLPPILFRNMESYLNLLIDLNNQPHAPKALEDFMREFVGKFDKQSIPIMQALDPELGIGYDNLDVSGSASSLIKSILKNRGQGNTGNLELEKFLTTESGLSENGKVVHLENIQLKTSEGKQLIKIPNVLSCVFSVVDDLIIVDNLGGYTVNQFSGRFSIASNEMHEFCKKVAEVEEKANPNVIFFDVAYLAELTVDNVNRRERIYEHEVNILNFSTSENPINIDDIYLSASGNQIILFSKKYKKRLIPRMASAYNYKRSDLPLFKLLCDIMHHGIKTDFSFNLGSILPKQRSYPRVQYKNIIVSAAYWKLYISDLKNGDKAFSKEEILLIQLKKLKVSRYVKIGKGDQTLCLDTNLQENIIFIKRSIEKDGEVILEEAILPKLNKVHDEKGNPYLAQFIMPLIHNEEIYPKSREIETFRDTINATFIPGAEWLSFEIYVHPQKSDELLSDGLTCLIHEHSNKIKKWFFIRFNENGHHLRFRIEVYDLKDIGILIQAMREYTGDYLASGIVSDIQIKTYRREMERYAVAGIDRVESLFHTDSQYSLTMMEYMFTDGQKYRLTIEIFNTVYRAIDFNLQKLLAWINTISDSFNKEHNIAPPDFKLINGFYKEIDFNVKLPLTPRLESHINQIESKMIGVLENCPTIRQLPLFTDLIHMHINRLFNEYQRTHEMVFYNLLINFLKKELSYHKKTQLKI